MNEQEFRQKVKLITDEYVSLGYDGVCLDGYFKSEELRRIADLFDEFNDL